MKYLFFTLIGLFLLMVHHNLQAQGKDSIRAWKIVVMQSFREPGRSETLPGSIYKIYTYYRHNSLVLRKEPLDTNRSHSNDSTKDGQGNVVTTSMSARIISPVYLIDLEKRLTYTFCKDTKFYVAVDSLARYQEDMIFRIQAANLPKNSAEKYRKDSEREERDLAGFPVIPMIAVYSPSSGTSRSSGDTLHYSRSANKMPIESPLNSFLPGNKYDLLEVCPSVPELPGARMCFTITKLEEVIVPKKMFSIPDEYEKRSDVPVSKVLQDILVD